MDYEKAYKEAIKRAKAIIEVAEKKEEIYKSAITIFPELRESEDERIRKEIEQLIQCMHDADPRKERWIAWLEKQGEHANFLNKIQIGDKVTRNEFGELVNISQLERIAKPRRSKPVSKFEPKFHEGEWIVDKSGLAQQVLDFRGGIYTCTYNSFTTDCESNYHLWTIQDAKDGDVLVASDRSIFIFKEVCGSSCKHYIALTSDKEIQVNTKLDKFWETARGVKPSTKEQRDTLLKAIADAGYTFDFEKKELKKIEKKPQRMVSAEAKEALYDKPTDEEMKELLRTEYEKGKADTLSEMKSSWSEEDECNLKCWIAKANYDLQRGNIGRNHELIDWLKSLKDRVQPQPKHKWSIEDERAIAIINNALTESNTPPDDYDKVYDWLESLKKG